MNDLDTFNNKAQKAIDSELTITIDTGSEYTNNVFTTDMITSSSTISSTISASSSPTYTISGIDATGYGWKDEAGNDIVINTHDPVDFTDCLPNFSKIQSMCSEYPGLDKAFDNFKMTYKMVHQDWVGKQKKK